MKKLGRIVKYTFLFLFGAIALFVIGVAVFMQVSPQFGGSLSDSQVEQFEQLDYYEDGVFQNQIATTMDISFSDGMGLLKQQVKGIRNGEPDFNVPVEQVLQEDLDAKQNKIYWFGHSAFLLQLNGKTILLDPMLGEVPAPVTFLGPARFTALPMTVADLPHIDFIIISHDHYDHLDYGSIKELAEKTDHFFVPLGVGAHLKSWGIASERITEMDWWNEQQYDNVKLAFAPSRHFSGRGFSRNETLWGSWVIQSDSTSIYFSGDGGYGPHFKEIGNKYGPFDLALLECGQYNELWNQIHMMPEETVQAGIDVQAKMMMPIHWGAFQLALHSWTDPIERFSAEAARKKVNWIAPKIGQAIQFDPGYGATETWWKE